jgi:hypothetical protein
MHWVPLQGENLTVQEAIQGFQEKGSRRCLGKAWKDKVMATLDSGFDSKTKSEVFPPIH